MQVSTAEFKKGLKIVFDDQPYLIVDFQHVKPGKGGAFVRTKLKHMRQGRVIDNTFRSGEKVELVDYEEKHMQFLYRDDRYHFMDTETYDQVSLSAAEVGDAREYLKENTEVDVDLVVGGRVHEHVVVALPVEQLHLAFVDDRLLELLVGAVGAVEDGAGAHVLELRADKGAALARLDVLELHHLEQPFG